MERLRRQVFDFPKGATWNLGPYRNQQGKVMTQWGMLMGRKYVQREGNGIMEHHAQNSFANLDEARIIFTYASYLEYQRELRIAQSVSANPQHVAFIKVTDSIIMALVKFTLPASEDGAVDRFVPRDGTVIKIGFRPPNKFGLKKTFCSAIAMPNVFNLPYESNALFYVPGASFGFYQKFAVEVGQRVIFLPAAIAIRVPAAGAQRQVDAMNRLCYPAQERWHRILLNQHAGARRIIDPFSGLDFDSEEVETAIDTVLNIPGITWTAGQRKVIESLREFPERLLLIEGFPGTGKSLTLMGIAAVCRLLDIHVIYTTPTHFAGDAACETADKFMQLSHMSMDVLRVYRPVSEARAFQTHGRDTRKEVTDDEEHENFDPSEFTQMGPMPQSAIEDESFIPMNVSSDSQVLISQLINNMKEDHFAKSYGVPSKSLESHVIRLAMNEERTLVASYPSEEQIAKSKGDLYDLIEDGLDPEGEEVDMLAEIRKFTSMLQEKNFRQFSDEEKRKALLAFKKAAQLVVQEATFLISTNNNAGDSMISTHFGKDAKAIIQIRDEDFKETEPNSWVFAAKSVFSHKVVGIISCGDEKQLQPTVLSAYDQPKLNEFSAQLRLPMPTRLSRMGHPTHKLDEQFRYRPVFAEFPNRRTYNGQLKSHPSTNEITVLPGYLKAMKALILTGPTPAVGFVGKDNDPNVPSIDTPRHSSNIDYGNLVISVRNSTCTVEEVGKSRYNDAHRLLVVQIVMMNHRHGGYKSGDITVITPYTAQLVRIRQTFFRMVQLGILSPENVPFVSTTDSMQGKESKLVIYDWVISSADRMSDLGFTTDDHRGNVGLTRVIEAMVNILPGEIGNSRFLVQPQERHNYMGELVKSRVPYPCEFISWANQQGLLLEVECPDEQSLMKEPVGGVIGKLTRAVSTKPLGRISQASTGAATTLWSSATQVMTWVFSRKRTNADSNNSDVISNVPENINAPEEHTDPLEGPNNEWTAPPDTASEVWHDNHTEMLEPSVGDETAVAADSSLPLEAFSQVQSEPPVVSPPEITVIGVENSAVADEDIAPCIGEWSSGWAASGADW
ncbi:AAA domain-containing protein [Aspergillus candidus]|uniref:AAA domain-domain-containing protein n=1 Tax=Aspergillus candidus TaxID=41067 RepID=A0A2I2F1R6_ASPCN|nr:AAA domain-domain-containing protein [Aspergillus candidus]PLB34583.1 AAA domain-domain-containing protein [Aspergillus candidus]